MKRHIAYTLLCTLALLVGCNSADLVELPPAGNGRLLLNFSSSESETRADADPHLAFETLVQHIDVFIFNTSGSKLHYERVSVGSNAKNGTIALQGKNLSDLAGNIINIYAVANSAKATDVLAGITSVSTLQSTVETTELVYLTGSGLSSGSNTAPEAFLMWGEGEFNNSTNIQIEATPTGDKTITLPLVRAVAKVEIHFMRETGLDANGSDNGTTPQFHGFGTPANLGNTPNAIDLTNAGDNFYTADGSYYLRNMPFKSEYANSYHSETGNAHLRKTATITNNGHFHYESKDLVKVVAYVYSHKWDKDDSHFENASTMVVNLPAVKYNDPAQRTQGTYLADNYYEIPLRLPTSVQELTLERNTHYVIRAKINAPGSTSSFEPIEITPFAYDEYPWNEVSIEIGGDGGASYLTLNTDYIEMRNIAQDASTLRFASSSPISNITLLSATYIDKFGQTQNASQSGITTSYDETAITGGITINSPLPTNDAARTMTFEVTNADGLTEEFTVVQYPVIYITNILGYYSYRSDWKTSNSGPSHYENRVSPYYSYSDWDDSNEEWDNGKGQGTSERWSAFFRAKVNTDTKTTGYNRGKSDLDYYYWNSSNTLRTYSYRDADDDGNARMYHVHVTATSSEYIVGRPKLDANGYTDAGEDNAKLVSPSFMIASQLGATQSGYDHTRAQQHCAQYVEVYKDENGNSIHLDDWRLPTDAEIKIITASQYKPNSAMDEVLAGYYYHSASDRAVANENDQDGEGTYTRCVRDHYEPTTNALSE